MRLLPRNPKFFDLFDDMASLVHDCAQILWQTKASDNLQPLLRHARRARKLENQADDICHLIYKEVDSTFITPIDREDIYQLAKNLDNVIDLTENVSAKLYLYHITRFTRDYSKMTRLVLDACKEIKSLIDLLKHNGKHSAQIKKLVISIHSLENKGDRLLGHALRDLFADNKSPTEIIKWKDLYENLEQILDECEDTSDTVENIMIKNF